MNRGPGAGLLLLLLIAGCVSSPPEQVADVFEIFEEKGGWYDDASRAERRWGVPVAVLMAFTHQESSYKGKSKPPRGRLLWVIPWRRPSSAYGYAQATDEAWTDYKKATGRYRADRDDFGDAMDFVGWYNRRSSDLLGIPRNDASILPITRAPPDIAREPGAARTGSPASRARSTIGRAATRLSWIVARTSWTIHGGGHSDSEPRRW